MNSSTIGDMSGSSANSLRTVVESEESLMVDGGSFDSGGRPGSNHRGISTNSGTLA
jgi:hypothetical protein